MKNILKRLSIGLTLGTSLLVFAIPAPAQTGNASDVTGAIITTGDIAGGAFAPSLTRSGTRISKAALLLALRQAISIISAQLAQGTLPVAVPGVAIASIPNTVQQTLLAVLTGTGDPTALESAIASLVDDPALAAELVAALQGLFDNTTASPANLLAAVQAYNAVIDASGSALSNPSPELVAVQSVLTALVSATSAAQ
ncbi:hypothetical protein [Chroogloeocystis siderophila]|jgi:hypothetical protein|uniref:DUF1400 domain-containing protein n=1 Tax=Chroogloeocystis siderophila 5.2 s.c.1 TaxID=247279 RepID=A0A1U7HGE4_9CHRO|nr:hypothetical protein [Chroogloeocystis siderophila]OKH22639.1 hypothetical protein NIES1031_19475 [Chroogloeocystis siderophila 5.2 s.c.1]